jgi:hypothetical protein
MNTYRNWNQTTLLALRKNVSRFHRVDGIEFFIEIGLAIPNRGESDETLTQRRESENVVTRQGTFSLAELPESAEIAFTVRVQTYGSSDYTNNTLKLANGVLRKADTKDTLFVTTDDNGKVSIVSGDINHMGWVLTDEQVAYMIANHLKMSVKDKARKQWKNDNGMLVKAVE